MFKDVIKQLRKTHKLTQKQLAEIIGVDISTVGKWEGKGNILPSDGVRDRIAEYFNVPLDYLMGRNPSQPTYDAPALELLSVFDVLNASGKQLVLDYCNMIATRDEYRQKSISDSAI